MSLLNLWMISAVVTPAGQIGQIVDQDLNLRIDELAEGGSGTPDTEFVAVSEAKPTISFTSTAVAAALGVAGINAYAIAAATDIYFQRVSQGGVRDNTAAIKITATKGILVPRMIEASQGGKKPATIKYDLHAISTDGTTAPLAIATGQTVPTITPVAQLYTLGTCGLNASALSAISKLSIDFGIKEQIVGCEGAAYPTFAGVISRRPRIKISGYDMSALSTFGMNGLALTSWKTYLRKIAPGSTRVADATAAHIKVFGTTGMFLPQSAKGTGTDEIDADWTIVPSYDGTNDVIQISTAIAIT